MNLPPARPCSAQPAPLSRPNLAARANPSQPPNSPWPFCKKPPAPPAIFAIGSSHPSRCLSALFLPERDPRPARPEPLPSSLPSPPNATVATSSLLSAAARLLPALSRRLALSRPSPTSGRTSSSLAHLLAPPGAPTGADLHISAPSPAVFRHHKDVPDPVGLLQVTVTPSSPFVAPARPLCEATVTTSYTALHGLSSTSIPCCSTAVLHVLAAPGKMLLLPDVRFFRSVLRPSVPNPRVIIFGVLLMLKLVMYWCSAVVVL
nr:vegetative cell wall protein gp1-like [Lolium perenne]